MADVTRYIFDSASCRYEHPDGEYVGYDAYANLEAEVQVLRDQVKTLQSDANSYQSGYDEGRRMGTKHRQSEVEQLTREVEALRARVVVVPDSILPHRERSSVDPGFNEALRQIARLNGRTVSEGLLLRIEQECRINHDWNCQNVPAGTRSATTRARKMLEIADELRGLLDEGKEDDHV